MSKCAVFNLFLHKIFPIDSSLRDGRGSCHSVDDTELADDRDVSAAFGFYLD